MRLGCRSAATSLAAILIGSCTVLAAGGEASPIMISVDASDAPRKIIHARIAIPAEPGLLRLYYPKWIPGEHGPTGPVTDLAGLKFTASGRILSWRRDTADMYGFLLDVPAGARMIEVELDYLSPAVTEGFSSSASATAQLAVLSWNQFLLYPAGSSTDELTYTARLKLPAGWSYGTALPVAREAAGEIEFEPVSLTTLVDSPVIAGANFRTVDLTPGQTPAHLIHMAADSVGALDMAPAMKQRYSNLVAEAYRLFGARHYRSYHFLLSLSEHVAHFGLEHHESSDNRTWERALIDEDRSSLMSGLLPHEMVHSWNGKYRRPADLATSDYQQPMRTELLWVYEGLTTYLGGILSARSGLQTQQRYLDDLALSAASVDNHRGRSWRPLEDTAVAAQLLYEARPDWLSWRRGVDFYPEGSLIWLEADVIIRQSTDGRRSLDDFCRRFFDGGSGGPRLKPYTFDDVVSELNLVTPYDWRGFFHRRVSETNPRAPLGGVEGSGWRLVYNDILPALLKSIEQVREKTDLSYSIGLTLRKDGGIEDVVPRLPAADAGIGPGMMLVAVNGRKWSRDILRAEIKASKTATGPLELLVENGEFYRTYRLDYHGGERYPHLERDASRPDLLSMITKPQLPSAMEGKPGSRKKTPRGADATGKR